MEHGESDGGRTKDIAAIPRLPYSKLLAEDKAKADLVIALRGAIPRSLLEIERRRFAEEAQFASLQMKS